MRIKSLPGKVLQLRRGYPSMWWPFLIGWLNRNRTGFVPCIIAGCRKFLYVPLVDFYDSYEFFCETLVGSREIRFFLSKLRANEVLYDIGAFRGAYSTILKMKLQAGASVHAFEPIPKNFESVRRICALNRFKDFTIVPQAVGAEIFLKGSINERDVMLRLGDTRASSAETSFAAVSIDEYVARGNSVPTVIKIDVEGFELPVLQGAQVCLRKYRPRLWVEIHPEYLNAQSKSPDDVLALLYGLGYEVSFFNDYSHRSLAPYHVWCV